MSVTDSQIQIIRDLFDRMGEPVPKAGGRNGMKLGTYVGFVGDDASMVWFVCQLFGTMTRHRVSPDGSLVVAAPLPFDVPRIIAWRVADTGALPLNAMDPLERIRMRRPAPKVGDVVPAWMVPPLTIVQDIDGSFPNCYILRFEDAGEVVYKNATCKMTNDGIWPWSNTDENQKWKARIVALDVDPKIDNVGVQCIVDIDCAPPVSAVVSATPQSRPKVGDVVAWSDVPPSAIVRTSGRWFVLRCGATGEFLGQTVEGSTRTRRGDDNGDAWLWTTSAHVPRDGKATIVALDVDLFADIDVLCPAMWSYLRMLAKPDAKVAWGDVPAGTLVRTTSAVYFRNLDDAVDVESGAVKFWYGFLEPETEVRVLAVDVPPDISPSRLRQLATARSPERPVAALFKALGEDVPEPVRLRDAPCGTYAVTKPDSKCPLEFVCLADQDRYAWTTGGGTTAWEPDTAAWLWPVAGFRRKLLVGDLNEHVRDDAMDEALSAVFATHASGTLVVITAARLRTLWRGGEVRVGDEIDFVDVPVHALVLSLPSDGHNVFFRHVDGGEYVGSSTRAELTRTAPQRCCAHNHGRWPWDMSSFACSRVRVLALDVPCGASADDLYELVVRATSPASAVVPAAATESPMPAYVRELFRQLGDPSLPAATRLDAAPPGLYAVDGGLVSVSGTGERRIWSRNRLEADVIAAPQTHGWIAAASAPPSFPETVRASISRVRYAREYRPATALPAATPYDVTAVALKFRVEFDAWAYRWRNLCTPLVKRDVHDFITGNGPSSRSAESVLSWLPRVQLQRVGDGGNIVAAAWTVGHLDGLVRFTGRCPQREEAMCAAVDHAARVLTHAGRPPRGLDNPQAPDLRLWTGDGLGSAAWSERTRTSEHSSDRPTSTYRRVEGQDERACEVLPLGSRVSGTAAIVDTGSWRWTHGTRNWKPGPRPYVVGSVERAEDVPLWRLLVTLECARLDMGAVVIPDFSPIVVAVDHVRLNP